MRGIVNRGTRVGSCVVSNKVVEIRIFHASRHGRDKRAYFGESRSWYSSLHGFTGDLFPNFPSVYIHKHFHCPCMVGRPLDFIWRFRKFRTGHWVRQGCEARCIPCYGHRAYSPWGEMERSICMDSKVTPFFWTTLCVHSHTRARITLHWVPR